MARSHIKYRKLKIAAISGLCLLIIFSTGWLLVQSFTPDYKKLGPHFIYAQTDKTGCQGHFCIEEVQKTTTYNYATDLSIRGVQDYVMKKGYKLQSTDINTTNGVTYTDMRFSNDVFVQYVVTPPQDTMYWLGHKKLPRSYTGIVRIDSSDIPLVKE